MKAASSRWAETSGTSPPVGQTARHVPQPTHRAANCCSLGAPGGRSGARPDRARTTNPATPPTASEPKPTTNLRRQGSVGSSRSERRAAPIERMVSPNPVASSGQAASHRRQPMHSAGEPLTADCPIGQTAEHAPHWVQDSETRRRYGANHAATDKAAPSGQSIRHQNRGAKNTRPITAPTRVHATAAAVGFNRAPGARCSAPDVITRGSSHRAKFTPAIAAPRSPTSTKNLTLVSRSIHEPPGRRPRTNRAASIAVPSGHIQPQNTRPNSAVNTTSASASEP